jgi:hypothetical protein
MSNTGEIRYGLERLHQFPYYQTRQAYEAATGLEAPPFNPTRPPKYWFDPAANESTKRNVVYDQVIAYSASGSPLMGDKGQPLLEILMLTKDEAATVNIPPKELGKTNVPGADVPEIPPPLRPLREDEELFFPMGGIVAVRIKGTLEADRGFTEEDRALLEAIARKLGV